MKALAAGSVSYFADGQLQHLCGVLQVTAWEGTIHAAPAGGDSLVEDIVGGR